MASISEDGWLFFDFEGVLFSMKRRRTDMRCGSSTTSLKKECHKKLYIQHFCVLDLGVKTNDWSVIPGIPWLPEFWIDKTSQKTPTKPSFYENMNSFNSTAAMLVVHPIQLRLQNDRALLSV